MSIKLFFVLFQTVVALSGTATSQDVSDPEKIDRFFEYTGNRFPASRPPRVLVVSTEPAVTPSQGMYLASVKGSTTPAEVVTITE
jgi:hypothetical protein